MTQPEKYIFDNIFEAAKNGNLDSLKDLVQTYFPIRYNAFSLLHITSSQGHFHCVRWLIENLFCLETSNDRNTLFKELDKYTTLLDFEDPYWKELLIKADDDMELEDCPNIYINFLKPYYDRLRARRLIESTTLN